MDDIRNSFSRLKKDFKHRLGGKKRAPGGAGAEAAGERPGSPASLPQPDPRIIASRHDEEGGRVDADQSQDRSKDLSPQPESMPATEGRENPEGREVGVDEKEVNRSHSHLDPDVGVAVGGGSSREIKRTSSPPSVTPILPKQGPDST